MEIYDVTVQWPNGSCVETEVRAIGIVNASMEAVNKANAMHPGGEVVEVRRRF